MRKSTKENVDITTGLNLVYLAFSIFLLEEMNNDRLQFRFCFSILPPDGGALLNNLPGYTTVSLSLLFACSSRRLIGLRGKTVLIWWIRFELTFNRVRIFLLLLEKGNLFDKPAMIRDVNVLEEVLCLRF